MLLFVPLQFKFRRARSLTCAHPSGVVRGVSPWSSGHCTPSGQSHPNLGLKPSAEITAEEPRGGRREAEEMGEGPATWAALIYNSCILVSGSEALCLCLFARKLKEQSLENGIC